MTKAFVAIFMLAACSQEHATSNLEISSDDCYTCHKPEYEIAGTGVLGTTGCFSTPPVHQNMKPTTCADCHVTDSWCPALDGGHPEEAFPIKSGLHLGIKCLECHVPALGASTNGMNVSCIGCHTGRHDMARMADKHDEVGSYTWQPDRPAFCRDCHPRGTN